MNLPNKITVARIFMIPFFVFFLVYDIFDDPIISRVVSASLFIIASITDFVDGHIARKRGLITDFGKFMDPLADKFLILGAMFAMCFSDYVFDYAAVGFTTAVSVEIVRHLFFWTAIIVVFRELAVTSMRLVVAKSSGAVIAASMLGKIKTTTQIIGVAVVILEPVIFRFTQGWFSVVSLAAMLVFTVLSGVNYIKTYWKFINTDK